MNPTIPAKPTQFLLNDHLITTDVSRGTLVLDFLRLHQGQTGTKEGCREGDCGACTVLIGELHGEQIEYLPVTSCLMPLGELEGKHLVTIEGLKTDRLSPVQQAIVDEGATQCGFCTPGIVLSLTALVIDEAAELDDHGTKKALSGHLCRCTGYRSLVASGQHLQNSLGKENRSLPNLVKQNVLPEFFRRAPQLLQQMKSKAMPTELPTTGSVFIAGGTDLYVQREDLAHTTVEVLNLYPEMRGIELRSAEAESIDTNPEKSPHLRIGALTTFEEFSAHTEIQRLIPDIDEYMFLVASWQIRNRATLGGNIINASPIGDMTILLLALGSQLVLSHSTSRRTVDMADFYLDYKKMDLKPGEVLTEILIPLPRAHCQIHFEKVSKRRCLDIATVNSAIHIQQNDGHIDQATITVGGVAPIPLWLEETSQLLVGENLNRETLFRALVTAQGEITPISDVRGSADYKRLLVRQLLIGHFTRLFPEVLEVRDFYAAS